MRVFHLYKIRNKRTGLYATGGHLPRWTRAGKVWRSKSGLLQHLRAKHENLAWAAARELVGPYHHTTWESYSAWRRKMDEVMADIKRTCRLIPEDWEVVEIEVREEDTRTFDPNDLVGGAVD